MNLLFVTNVFPNPIDPTKGLFNYYLARALAGEHDVSVVAPISWIDELCGGGLRPWPKSAQRTENRDGIRLDYPRYYYPPKILRSRYGEFYWHSIRRRVRRVIERRRPDVVLSFWAHPDGEAAVRIARDCNVPAVVVVGGSDVLLLANDPSRRPRVASVLRSADAVVAVSSDLCSKVRQLGVRPEKVHVWNRGIDADIFSPGDRQAARAHLRLETTGQVLLWVGRMVAVKGLDTLLDACAILRRQQFAFRLYLVGDGPLRSRLEKRSCALGLGDTVSFVGPRLHDELPDWYRAADLTVLPSRSEGLPNVLRESLACGTPFVASRVGGVPELACENRQRLVTPGDPVELASAIVNALEAGECQLPARRQSSWSDSANAFVRILEPLVSRREAQSTAPPALEFAST